MGLVIPHNLSAMIRALSCIEDGEVDNERLEALSKEKADEYFPMDSAEFDRRVAEFHGVDLKILTRSSTYKKLYMEYCYEMTNRFVEDMKNELILTDVQAWALLSIGAGLLSEKV